MPAEGVLVSAGCAVSIVMPTYNRAARALLAVDTLLRQQTDEPFEVIAVDDGSTDGTAEELARLGDPRLRVLRQDNRERGAARNHGARFASGRYCNFFDSDDLAAPEHVATAISFARTRGDPELFHLGYEVRSDAGKLLKTVAPQGRLNGVLLEGNLLSCNAVFVRSDVARAFPFEEDRRLSATEDWLLWLRLAARFPVHGCPAVTSVIVQHEARSTMLADEPKLCLRRDLLVACLDRDEVFARQPGALRRVRSRMTLYVALHLALGGRPLRSLAYLVEAGRIDPSALLTRQALGTLKHALLTPARLVASGAGSPRTDGAPPPGATG